MAVNKKYIQGFLRETWEEGLRDVCFFFLKKGNNKMPQRNKVWFLAEIKLAKGLIHLWDPPNTGRNVLRFGLKSCLSC